MERTPKTLIDPLTGDLYSVKKFCTNPDAYIIEVKDKIDISDAEDFLASKDIFNHPYIGDRLNNSHEVAKLLVEFANNLNPQKEQNNG